MTATIRGETIGDLKKIVGPKGWIESAVEKAPFLVDFRELYHGQSPLIVRPATTQEVCDILKVCSAAGVAIVPQGGNTGHVGGATPHEEGNEILLSLSRLNNIRAVDPIDYSITVEAGCILAHVQEAAKTVDRLFPLSLGAEGTCQIGGNLSSNAGGIAVLRYGNMRDLVLGLEVVLPDGTLWNGLRSLRKDNRGYDLKQLFIGAEGTLGVITAAVLKLFPQPRARSTFFIAVRDPKAASHLLADFRAQSGDLITSFEYMHRTCLTLLFETLENHKDPFDQVYEHYVLVELSAGSLNSDLQALAETIVGGAMEDGDVLDAVVASNSQQADALWHLREDMGEAQKRAGGCIKHDVSVAVSKVPDLLALATTRAEAMLPGARVIPFGHMGDGNIHFNIAQDPSIDRDEFLAQAPAVNAEIHKIVADLGGSFSAEHGVGRLKRDELRCYKSAAEIALMEKIKAALDPKGLMNPGKVL